MDMKQAGTLIDEAVTAFHQNNKLKFLAAGRELPKKYREKLLAYCEDDRNQNVISVQDKVDFKIGGVHYIGRSDQIRKINGRLSVWEIKFSTMQAKDCLQFYLSQLIAYAYGLNLIPGGIVNIYNYYTKNPVFIQLESKLITSIQMLALNKLTLEALNEE